MIYTEKRKSLFDFITFLITVLCICLSVWSINIFRDTIIDWKILAAPTIIGMVVFLIFFWKVLVKIGYSTWAVLFIVCACGGCLTHFGFMYLNQEFAQKDIVTEIFTIERKGSLAKGRSGCGQPYAIINFDGFEKEIIFSCDSAGTLKKFSKIKISYAKGFLGYNVIKGKSLLN